MVLPRPYSLPSHCRIKKRHDYLAIQERGKKAHTTHMVIAAVPTNADEGRLGITISRRCQKSSVKRNRFKRLVREVYRFHKERLAATADIVVIARRDASGQSLLEIEEEILFGFRKLRLL